MIAIHKGVMITSPFARIRQTGYTLGVNKGVGPLFGGDVLDAKNANITSEEI